MIPWDGATRRRRPATRLTPLSGDLLAAELRQLAVSLTQTHARVEPASTPQAVAEHLADAHDHLIGALAELRRARQAGVL